MILLARGGMDGALYEQELFLRRAGGVKFLGHDRRDKRVLRAVDEEDRHAGAADSLGRRRCMERKARALFAALAYNLDRRASRGRLAFQRISGALHGSAMQLRRKKRRIVIREFADAL